jgi:hypothetical protein
MKEENSGQENPTNIKIWSPEGFSPGLEPGNKVNVTEACLNKRKMTWRKVN